MLKAQKPKLLLDPVTAWTIQQEEEAGGREVVSIDLPQMREFGYTRSRATTAIENVTAPVSRGQGGQPSAATSEVVFPQRASAGNLVPHAGASQVSAPFAEFSLSQPQMRRILASLAPEQGARSYLAGDTLQIAHGIEGIVGHRRLPGGGWASRRADSLGPASRGHRGEGDGQVRLNDAGHE